MTSFIAAGGSGRSTTLLPPVPAASSVTTIAFMGIVSAYLSLWWFTDERGYPGSREARSQSVDTRPEELSDDRPASGPGAGPTIRASETSASSPLRHSRYDCPSRPEAAPM